MNTETIEGAAGKEKEPFYVGQEVTVNDRKGVIRERSLTVGPFIPIAETLTVSMAPPPVTKPEVETPPQILRLGDRVRILKNKYSMKRGRKGDTGTIRWIDTDDMAYVFIDWRRQARWFPLENLERIPDNEFKYEIGQQVKCIGKPERCNMEEDGHIGTITRRELRLPLTERGHTYYVAGSNFNWSEYQLIPLFDSETPEDEPTPALKFSVGDRVKVIQRHNTEDDSYALGRKGKVIAVDENDTDLTYEVRLKLTGGTKVIDNFAEYQLALREAKIKAAERFKVGDRVRIVKDHKDCRVDDTKFVGRTGTITSYYQRSDWNMKWYAFVALDGPKENRAYAAYQLEKIEE